MGKGKSFIDRNSVGDTITRIQYDTSRPTRGIQREYSLDGDVEGWGVESLKHDLGHLFTVGFGVKRSFSQENWVLLGGNTQFIVESMMPDLFHVIPISDNTMFDRVLEGKNTTF